MSDVGTVTQLLKAAQSGDSKAVDLLFPLIYDELRQRAHNQRIGFGGHATMNTTAIVHEAYFKLAQVDGASWQSRAHFYAVAAKAMRHVFLDYAKRKKRLKRGEGVLPVSIDASDAMEIEDRFSEQDADQILALEEALSQLSQTNQRAAQVVECRFFGGMTIEDTASVLQLSIATVKRDWILAKTLLFQSMEANA